METAPNEENQNLVDDINFPMNNNNIEQISGSNSNTNKDEPFYPDSEGNITGKDTKTDEGNTTKKKEQKNDLSHLLLSENEISKCIFLCGKCSKPPFIEFINPSKKINIHCICRSLKNVYYQIIEIDYKKENREVLCFKHNKKIIDFCEHCYIDFCEDCKKDRHQGHTKPQSRTKLRDKIKDLQSKIYNLDYEIYDNVYLSNIIRLIIKSYEKYNCYNYYKSISKAYKFLNSENWSAEEENIPIGEANSSQSIKMKNIIKEADLNKIKDDKSFKKVREINFSENKISNMSIFEKFADPQIFKKENENLMIINLFDNNINDISILTKIKAPNLKELILEKNEIGDKNLTETLSDLAEQFKNLKVLKLFENKISDFNIFISLSKFENLKILQLGRNNFGKEYEFPNWSELNFQNLKEIGLTEVLTEYTSCKLLSKLKFKNLKYLYISGKKNLEGSGEKNSEGNYIKTLEFMKYLSGIDLIFFWAPFNKIENYEELEKFKTLTQINLNNNKIQNIGNLEKFINSFDCLNDIRIKGNNIDWNDINNEGIKEYLEKEFKGYKEL